MLTRVGSNHELASKFSPPRRNRGGTVGGIVTAVTTDRGDP